jgi:hypothetical protein
VPEKESQPIPQIQQLCGSALSDWILGFVSAYNYYSAGGRDVTFGDGSAFIAWMDSYCRDHPHEMIADAAYRLVSELVAKRTALPSN